MKFFIHFLTISRIMLGPIIFVCLIMGFPGLSLILFTYAALTDYFDGFFARHFNMTSVLGAILDPIADKILIVFMFCGLIIFFNSSFIAICVSFILGREFLVGALREFNALNGNSEATQVTFLAKIKTTVQLITIGSFLFGAFLDSAFIVFISNFFLFAAMIITILTGVQYSLSSLAAFKQSNT